MTGITIEKRGVAIPSVLLKAQRGLLKELMVDALVGWRKRILPGHFKRGAVQRYGYQARTKRYQRMKTRRGLEPLVYSGQMRDRMKWSRRAPTGSSKKVTLRLPAVGFVTRKYRGWKHTMADEITKITAAEEKEICQRIAIEAGRLLSAQKGFQRTVLR